MKIRCMGYEGNLISLNPSSICSRFGDKYKIVLYEIVISLSQNEEITLMDVKDENIEFIKEKK